MEELKDTQQEVAVDTQELSDVQDFVLDTPEDGMVEVDLLQEIADHDFSSDEPTDFDKYFNVLESAEKDNEEFKSKEADNIIKDLSEKYVDKDYLVALNKAKDNIIAYMKKYDVNSDAIKNMTETEKDKIWAVGKFLNKYLVQKIKDLTFSFSFTTEEYKFVQTALRSRTSYNGIEVFNIIELKQKYLDKWAEDFKALPKGVSSFMITIDISNVVMLYHFLEKYSVKGIEAEFYNFVTVLQKISDTNKLFNAYNVIKDRVQSEYFVWSGSMTPMPKEDDLPETVNLEQSEGQKTIKGERLPK